MDEYGFLNDETSQDPFEDASTRTKRRPEDDEEVEEEDDGNNEDDRRSGGGGSLVYDRRRVQGMTKASPSAASLQSLDLSLDSFLLTNSNVAIAVTSGKNSPAVVTAVQTPQQRETRQSPPTTPSAHGKRPENLVLSTSCAAAHLREPSPQLESKKLDFDATSRMPVFATTSRKEEDEAVVDMSICKIRAQVQEDKQESQENDDSEEGVATSSSQIAQEVCAVASVNDLQDTVIDEPSSSTTGENIADDVQVTTVKKIRTVVTTSTMRKTIRKGVLTVTEDVTEETTEVVVNVEVPQDDGPQAEKTESLENVADMSTMAKGGESGEEQDKEQKNAEDSVSAREVAQSTREMPRTEKRRQSRVIPSATTPLESDDKNDDGKTLLRLYNLVWPAMKQQLGWTCRGGKGMVEWVYLAPGISRLDQAVENKTMFSSEAALMEWTRKNMAEFIAPYEQRLILNLMREFSEKRTKKAKLVEDEIVKPNSKKTKQAKVIEEVNVIEQPPLKEKMVEAPKDRTTNEQAVPIERYVEDEIRFGSLWQHLVKTKGWHYYKGGKHAEPYYLTPHQHQIADAKGVYGFCARNPDQLKGLVLPDGTDAGTVEYLSKF